jgi:glycosyltransferase involved in cell wall biosynthesis
MRIGIDVRPLQAETKHRGIGKALEFFLRELALHGSEDEFVFYVDGKLPTPDVLQKFSRPRLITYSSPTLTRKKYIRSIVTPWRALRVSHRDIDVLLQYDAALGIASNVPSVVIFHDLIPYLFHEQEKRAAITPSWRRTTKNKLAGAAYWQQYLRILKRYRHARTIIAISETSKRDYISHFPPVPTQHLTVIPHGVDESFFKPAPRLSTALSKQVGKPYFVYVGGIDYRKNIAGLLKDFFELRSKQDARLVLVGKEFALQDQLDDLGWSSFMTQYQEYESDVIRPGFVSHEDLIALLSASNGLILPSLYEGFGMPALEAMATGCPVVAYDNSATAEVVKGYGTVLPDGDSFTATMEDLLRRPAHYTQLVSKAQQHARRFTWSATVEDILLELHQAASKA